ncbi:MAG: glutamate decarboxylase [Clostridia bacterium]|nr:glutamate decarboxylase [Clostridia bacterium]
MWRVVYIAPNQSMAETLKGALIKEGVLVTLRSIGKGSNQTGDGSVEILVSESEAEEAHEIINKSL